LVYLQASHPLKHPLHLPSSNAAAARIFYDRAGARASSEIGHRDKRRQTNGTDRNLLDAEK
jgi:hypothetical protein